MPTSAVPTVVDITDAQPPTFGWCARRAYFRDDALTRCFFHTPVLASAASPCRLIGATE